MDSESSFDSSGMVVVADRNLFFSRQARAAMAVVFQPTANSQTALWSVNRFS
jgi:hypothetical protein